MRAVCPIPRQNRGIVQKNFNIKLELCAFYFIFGQVKIILSVPGITVHIKIKGYIVQLCQGINTKKNRRLIDDLFAVSWINTRTQWKSSVKGVNFRAASFGAHTTIVIKHSKVNEQIQRSYGDSDVQMCMYASYGTYTVRVSCTHLNS